MLGFIMMSKNKTKIQIKKSQIKDEKDHEHFKSGFVGDKES